MRNPAGAAAANDAATAQAANGEEEKKEEERPAAAQKPVYKNASDTSFFIEKSSNQTKAPKKEAFVPDFDEDEVPPLE